MKHSLTPLIWRKGIHKLIVPVAIAYSIMAYGVVPAYADAVLDPVQSAARPFGLSIVDPVYQAASTPQAADFKSNTLSTLNAWIQKNLPEYTEVKNFSSITLDPSMLTVKTTQDVTVYFVGEGAGYQNTLGFNTTGVGTKTGNPQLIFPNASSNISSYIGNPSAPPSTSAPLMPGDFVNLGTMPAGTKLDFFLIANGASGGTNVFSTTTSANVDGIRHVVAYTSQDSPYLLIGFEDMLGGGDKDYNDVLIAINGTLTTAPEPSTLITLGSFLLLAIYLKRRQLNHTLKDAFL